MTNTIANIAQHISTSTDWTFVFSTISVTCAVVFGIVNILKNKKVISEEQLRDSAFIKEIKEKCEKTGEKYDKTVEKGEALKGEINQLTVEVERLKMQTAIYDGDIKELKGDYNEIIEKIEEMLRQIKTYLN